MYVPNKNTVNIFVILLCINKRNKFHMSHFVMQIVYNAEGELLNAIVVHDGAISDSLHHHYSGKVGFIKTPDGQLNYDCLGGCLQHIYEYSTNIINCMHRFDSWILLLHCSDKYVTVAKYFLLQTLDGG